MTAEKSKDILKNLEDQIDQIEDEELDGLVQQNLEKEQESLAFNQEQQHQDTFNVPT